MLYIKFTDNCLIDVYYVCILMYTDKHRMIW